MEEILLRHRERQIGAAESALVRHFAQRRIAVLRRGERRHPDHQRLAEAHLHQMLERLPHSGAVIEKHLMPRPEHEFVVAEQDHLAGEVAQHLLRHQPVAGFGDDVVEAAQLHSEQWTVFDIRHLFAVELHRQSRVLQNLLEQQPRILAQDIVEGGDFDVQRFKIEKTDPAVRRQSHVAAHETAGAAHPADQLPVGQMLQRPVDGFLRNPVAGGEFRRTGQLHARRQLAADDIGFQRLHDILAFILAPGFPGDFLDGFHLPLPFCL